MEELKTRLKSFYVDLRHIFLSFDTCIAVLHVLTVVLNTKYQISLFTT